MQFRYDMVSHTGVSMMLSTHRRQVCKRRINTEARRGREVDGELRAIMRRSADGERSGEHVPPATTVPAAGGDIRCHAIDGAG